MNKPRKSLDALAEEFVFSKPEAIAPEPPSPKTEGSSILSKMLEPETKEATIRFTVDMPESLHRKLSIFAARSGKKKAEIVRVIVEDALNQVNE